MNTLASVTDDYNRRAKWLIGYRVVFAVFLLASTIFYQVVQKTSFQDKSLFILYGVVFSLIVLSVAYRIQLNRIQNRFVFVLAQLIVDTLLVTFIVFVTGGYNVSVFTFMYLIVIVHAGMILFRKGGMIIAALSSAEYVIMTTLEHFRGGAERLQEVGGGSIAEGDWLYAAGKVLVITAACFAVAYLSGLLAEQAERTRHELSLMEKRIKRFEKMATVGEMAAGLAHEIKNPLASISSSIQLLRDDQRYDPDQNRLMGIVLREADRLSSLVNDFLLFAKPPAVAAALINLDDVLSETIELFAKDSALNGRIRIRKDLASGVVARIDPVHLRQIVWNLLLNASEAIKGQGCIDVSTYSLKNNDAVIKISDDGCGMPADRIESIFDPFFTTKADGTGLGLSIVYSIVEAYGGWLDVESKVDESTTITLTLRRTKTSG